MYRLPSSMVAVDIGNSRIKLGRFDAAPPAEGSTPTSPLPEPAETLTLVAPATGQALEMHPLADWLRGMVTPGTPLIACSVSRTQLEQLQRFLASLGEEYPLQVLTASDFPIENQTAQPERVGSDRLAAAVAANAVRRPNTPAIVVDLGTAVTVDRISAEGAFEGGAILPGMSLAAHALHHGTDALPATSHRLEGKSPRALGRQTEEAIQAGLYWGLVGGVRELIARQSDGLVAMPQVLVTGGVSPEFARLLGSPNYTVRFLPHLVMIGLALTFQQLVVGESKL